MSLLLAAAGAYTLIAGFLGDDGYSAPEGAVLLVLAGGAFWRYWIKRSNDAEKISADA
ncbi:MAG: hypothetical protein ABL308_14120 [Oceanicaulis sp.]